MGVKICIMVEECGCVHTHLNNPITQNTSNDIWNGGSLCIGGLTNGETLNQVITALANYVCSLTNSVNNLIIDDKHVIFDSGHESGCVDIEQGDTLHVVIDKTKTVLCNLKTDVTNLTSLDVKLSGITTNCLSIVDGDNITQAFNALLTAVCGLNLSRVQYPDFYQGEKLQIPLFPFNKNMIENDMPQPVLSSTDLHFTIFPANYWVDGQNISKLSQVLLLTANSDNYIYLDHTNNFAWAISAVPVGYGVSGTGFTCYKVTTNSVTYTTIVTLIKYYPINGTIIDDKSITNRHLDSTVVYSDGALKQETDGSLGVNTDEVTTQKYNSGSGIYKIRVKDGSISKVKLGTDIAGAGCIQNGDNTISPRPDKSIVLNGNYLELIGDINSPNPDSYYGTNSSSVLGYNDMPIKYKRVVIPAANVLTLQTYPYTLITNPYTGAPTGKYFIKVVDCVISLEYNNTPYTLNSPTDKIKVGLVPSYYFEFPSATLTGVVNIAFRGIITDTSNAANNIVQYNNNVVASIDANPTLGDSDVVIHLWYQLCLLSLI